MRVVDTSAWIEWLAGTPLATKLAKEIPTREQCSSLETKASLGFSAKMSLTPFSPFS
jgi:predicted nucleic acid-binding protein